GHSTVRPQAQCSRKGFVHGLLGEIEIAEQADQSCQDASSIDAIKGIERFAYLLSGMLGHDDDLSKAASPNQFGNRRIAEFLTPSATLIFRIRRRRLRLGWLFRRWRRRRRRLRHGARSDGGTPARLAASRKYCPALSHRRTQPSRGHQNQEFRLVVLV